LLHQSLEVVPLKSAVAYKTALNCADRKKSRRLSHHPRVKLLVLTEIQVDLSS